MSLTQQIYLRYRGHGHVRFELPQVLCSEQASERLITFLRQLPGVYAVQVYRRQRKLSIRFTEEITPFTSLIERLCGFIQQQEQAGTWVVSCCQDRQRRAPEASPETSGPMHWLRQKYQEVKETAQASGILLKIGLKKKDTLLKDPEKTVIDFLNDVLILYLIKIHWHMITQHWMLRPWRYRSEWMAVFYLMYLFMRSRVPKRKS